MLIKKTLNVLYLKFIVKVRVCTVLCKFDEYSILFVSIYMPCDGREKP